MDAETQQKIEATVLEILEDADMESLTEHKVRAMAAEKLGLDLSLPDRKRFVRRVVESFLVSKAKEHGPKENENENEHENAKNDGGEEEEGKDDGGGGQEQREYDDEGDLIICHLSKKRRVTIQEFRGKRLVSIREFYEKDGKQLPTSKGISLTVDQWEAFRKAIPAIQDAIKRLEGSD
ncbi:RNA polymerase II transcriptional coactivator KELP [Ananas comosus]|uniref:RNA polymerase II transcriptional coactivator KELP n=1 Tax=Ananas comosus TaxID=4615 RepID=A0A199UQJ9_ANACO|nr:RNA polymerase II transcriptional coactivator KELP [Ananas comosus]